MRIFSSVTITFDHAEESLDQASKTGQGKLPMQSSMTWVSRANFSSQVAKWWHACSARRAAMNELETCSANELRHRASRVGVARLAPWRTGALATVALLLFGGASAQTQAPALQRGLAFVRNNCAGCHAIDKVSLSPLAIAPPFRELHKRYPVESLQEALAEGIQTGHQNMPEFRLEPDQIGDVIAYLKTLER
jgi:mono/diheme cytochrome c family protein